VTVEDVARNIKIVIAGLNATTISLGAARDAVAAAADRISPVSKGSPDLAATSNDLEQVERRLTKAHVSLTSAAESLCLYLVALGVPDSKPISANNPSDRHHRPDGILHGRFAKVLHDFDELLPSDPAAWSNRPREAMHQYCDALANLAKGLALLANSVTGSISYALDHIAEGLKAPMSSPGMEIVLAAANQMVWSGDAPQLSDPVSADKIVELVAGYAFFPGLQQLKLAAFLLRTAGIVLCLGDGRALLECRCLPDFIADAGTTIVDVTGGILTGNSHE
jgi:hypothetical protein